MEQTKTYNDLLQHLVIIPKEQLDSIQKNQEQILHILQTNSSHKIPEVNLVQGKYLPEPKAKELLGKGTTWFWQMRKAGSLRFTKVGNRIYYHVDDIEKLFNNNQQGGML